VSDDNIDFGEQVGTLSFKAYIASLPALGQLQLGCSIKVGHRTQPKASCTGITRYTGI
jgi:hypothetical protein